MATEVDNFRQNQSAWNQPELMSVNNVADFLKVSTATVHNWVKCGILPLHDLSHPYVFDKKNIEKLKLKLVTGQLEKLNRRANKIKSKKIFIPKEYTKNKKDQNILQPIILFFQKSNIDITTALFLLSLNFLKKQNILTYTKFKNIIQKKDINCSNQKIKKEIDNWFSEICKKRSLKECLFFLDCDLPELEDCLGVLYQSFLFEGEKSKKGSYYTPSDVVADIVQEYAKPNSKIWDPCCGTGQFLLAFSSFTNNPLNIYGMDADPIAVKIARLNILSKFKNKDFIPHIFQKDTLFDLGNYSLFTPVNNKNFNHFDIIATNPPWGARFSKEEKRTLRNIYPEINSFESFSYFIKESLNRISDQGIASFILPESILNVRTHKDIREIILKNFEVIKIIRLGRIFKNVFTPVIRIDLKKTLHKQNNQAVIQSQKKKYKIRQMRWSCNLDFVFDIDTDPSDQDLINKVYKTEHTTLKNKATWALGIVTGDNKQFISKNKQKGYKPVWTGKEVQKWTLSKPACYIHFQPDKFQQMADLDKYLAPEKLIYRFISKELIFAYDNKKKLTLNSANIVIPDIKTYPIKVILSLFNSSIYQFIFQKKFSSIKVLRSHIEDFPLPLWDQKICFIIIRMVNNLLQGRGSFQKLDNYIMNQFNFSETEKQYIKESIGWK